MKKGSHLHTHIIAHVVEVRIILQLKNQICLCVALMILWEDELEEPCIKKAPTLPSSQIQSLFLITVKRFNEPQMRVVWVALKFTAILIQILLQVVPIPVHFSEKVVGHIALSWLQSISSQAFYRVFSMPIIFVQRFSWRIILS